MSTPSCPSPRRNTPIRRCRRRLIDGIRGWKTVHEHHGAGSVAAEIEAKRRALPIHPKVAGILGIENAFPVTQSGHHRAAGLLSQHVSVGEAPLAPGFFDDLGEPARARAEEAVTGIDDLVGGILAPGGCALGALVGRRWSVRLRSGPIARQCKQE